MSSDEIKKELKALPSTSFWLKSVLESIDERNPIDALKDIELLTVYLKKKVNEVISINLRKAVAAHH